MGQSSSSKTNGCSAIQGICFILRNSIFIAVFTRARHWARCFLSTPHNNVFLRYTSFYTYYLQLPSYIFSSGFPTKPIRNYLLFHGRHPSNPPYLLPSFYSESTWLAVNIIKFYLRTFFSH